jgi:hypothetical protein
MRKKRRKVFVFAPFVSFTVKIKSISQSVIGYGCSKILLGSHITCDSRESGNPFAGQFVDARLRGHARHASPGYIFDVDVKE